MTRGGLTGIEFAEKGVGFTPRGLIALLDQLPVALAVTRGPQHIYVYANALYKSIHEPSLGKLTGRSFASVFGPVLGEDYVKLRNQVLRRGIIETVHDVRIVQGSRDSFWDIMLVPVAHKGKKADAVMSIAVDVTERAQARQRASQSQRLLLRRTKEVAEERDRLSVAVEATGIGIWEWRVKDNEVIWSARMKDIFGLRQDQEATYEIWHDSLHPEDRQEVLAKVNALLEPSSDGQLRLSHRVVSADGRIKWIESRARMLYGRGKKGRTPLRLLGTSLDVTDWQKAQEQLHEAVAMKDMLLRETHHRVKNSLQIVSAMLSLQERMAISPDLKAGLTDAAMRIRTVAALHEQLHQAQSTTAVELSAYLSSLCKDLESTVGNPELKVEFTGETLWVANERAISIALIVNELTTNALKYAYPTGAGIVRVRFSQLDGERIKVVVEDEGVGLGGDFSISEDKSLGHVMAQTLARQLGGEIVMVETKRGARFELIATVRES